jgi:YesN/AraC family two-component response regulator
MLLLCAESVSQGSRKYHEMLMLRSEQTAALSSLIEKYKTKYSNGGAARPAYPADKARLLIQALRKGDKDEAKKILNEVLAILIIAYSDQFKHIQYRALELAVLLIRAGVNSGNGTAVENNTRFLKRIQDGKTVEDLSVTLHGIVENITGQIILFQGIPHASAILKAEQYIRENFTRKISLHEISRIAGLSAPYFSTIFKDEMGENFSGYINRLRVEKAGKMLLETELSIGEISGACGFEDQSWFSKIFKAFTGISPGKYRNRGGLQL